MKTKIYDYISGELIIVDSEYAEQTAKQRCLSYHNELINYDWNKDFIIINLKNNDIKI